MLIKKLKGLKYPDEYVTRFFFKEKLHERKGRAIEFGCGNASNLMLFYQYGYEVTGVDISQQEISDAIENFSQIKCEYKLGNEFKFIKEDMLKFIGFHKQTGYEAVLLPSSLYYMSRVSMNTVIKLLSERNYLKPSGYLYLRVRTPEDFRFGKGELIAKNSYRLEIDVTGEKGCVVTFLKEEELMEMVGKYFKFNNSYLLHLDFDNIQNGNVVKNRDLIFWGQVT